MKHHDTRIRASELLSAGHVTRLDALAEIRDATDRDGVRVIDVRLAGGLSFEVLPQRGLDIGSLWHQGSPVSWRSALPSTQCDVPALGAGFLSRFKGGMLVTCGLDNVGPERDDYPLHGTHTHTAASDVRYTRELVGEHIVVTVTGLIASMELFGRRLIVERRIVASTGIPRLEVIDHIRNEGQQASPVALLYHVNFGAPFLDEGTRVEVDAAEIRPRYDGMAIESAARFPEPTNNLDEAVFEHVAPVGRVTVLPQHGGVATLDWKVATLPKLFQWVWPAAGGWALGIEPSNSPLFGDDRNLPHAGAPVLESGESLETGFSLDFSAHSDDLNHEFRGTHPQ
ncbi:DUF4432 family protein [Salinibacterium sp. M195]|uniref:DUF4432 family protein n=1 Tax=Salinibacterium sp. M195 TaxID=2583374 RepID=UPI001C62611F|nr:DUF4432 family protein [Salinibacterium sp. M195]QYH35416.1 DUF4432 family protein [Salinibacterium sp. M195]